MPGRLPSVSSPQGVLQSVGAGSQKKDHQLRALRTRSLQEEGPLHGLPHGARVPDQGLYLQSVPHGTRETDQGLQLQSLQDGARTADQSLHL